MTFNSQNIPPTAHTNRNFGLDVFRAIAILFVVNSHGGILLEHTALNGFPYIPMIDGVTLFFVLSGFLIGGILLRTIEKQPVFDTKALLYFWKRRWLRTIPNYYLVVFLNLIFIRFHIISGDLGSFNWRFLLFLQNFTHAFYGFFWESWSLSVEEWFYIFLPIILYFLLKFLPLKKAFLVATLLLIAAPTVYRFYLMPPNVDAHTYDHVFRKVVVLRLDSIAYGLFGAWFLHYYKVFWVKYRLFCFVFGFLGILWIVNAPNFYMHVLYFSLTPLAALFLLPMAEKFENATGYLAKFITHISKISYSMYLINLCLALAIIAPHGAPTNPSEGILKYVLFWITTIGASTLLYRFFEKPIMNWRDKE